MRGVVHSGGAARVNGSSVLAAWERVTMARHPERPYALDCIARLASGFHELRGDRLTGDDPALVADAAGSDLLSVDSSGAITDLATFMPRPVTLPNGTTVNLNPVPTAVATGADCAFYVGELTGGPFSPGAAQIWRVVRGQQPLARTLYAR